MIPKHNKKLSFNKPQNWKRLMSLGLIGTLLACMPDLNNPTDPNNIDFWIIQAIRCQYEEGCSGKPTPLPTPLPTDWHQEAYIKVANKDIEDLFGKSTSISGDTIVVSAPSEDSNQTTITSTTSTDNTTANSGAVYVFKRNSNIWALQAFIKAPFPDLNDFFGISVAIDADTIAIGAHLEDSSQSTITSVASSDGSSPDSGAVYVFQRTANTWTLQAYLKASNNDGANDQFGSNVSIAGDTIVVGAGAEDSNQITITNGITASGDGSINSGAVYVFHRSGTIWTQQAYIKAPNNDASDFFGGATSIDGDTIVVGTTNESSNQISITNGINASADNSNATSGAAYVFQRSGSTWSQQAYIKTPNNDVGGDQFGGSVSISGDTIVVGAAFEDSNQTTITNNTIASANNGNTNSGAVYVFQRIGSTWAQQAYIKAPNNDADDKFGKSVSISGDTIAVGAKSEDSNQITITNGITASANNTNINSGAVYIFQRTGSTWAQQSYFKAPNNDVGDDGFGSYVSISGDTVIVAAENEDSSQSTITNGTTASSDNSISNSGAVYVFKRE